MGKNVFLLEDNTDLLNMFKLMVELDPGNQAITAAGVPEMHSKSDSVLGCQVAFLDVDLGADQPNGVDACMWLKKKGFHGKIYFLTGHARSHPMVAKAVEQGNLNDCEVLTKPLSKDHLLGLIEKAI